MIDEERDKAINVDDNNGHQTNDEVTLIVNETLKELQNVQLEAQKKDTVMIEKQTNVDIPSSSKETNNTESYIQIRFRQIREKNEELKSEVYSKFPKENPGNKDRLL